MVTIVMPAFNEVEIIERSVMEWYEEVIAKLPGSELLVVDDCSTDGTGSVLNALARRLPGVRVVTPCRNSGHGKALLFGFHYAKAPYVFQTDSDRQHVPSEFWHFWSLRGDADFVFGVRKSRGDGRVRLAITRIMRLLNLMLWGVWVEDANCPFKLMRRAALENVLEEVPKNCFIPMVVVSILSRRMGLRVLESQVTHRQRGGGTPSLRGVFRWVHVGLLCTGQLLALRLRLQLRPGISTRHAQSGLSGHG